MKKVFESNDRFLSLEVYKFPLGACGGVTDSPVVKSIYIPCAEGPSKFENINPALIFIPEQRGAEYWAVKPYLPMEGGVGPMAGGNLAYSSDSRCKRVYHIHDRFESQATYNALSR